MAAKRSLLLAALQAMNDGVQDISPEELLERFGSVLAGRAKVSEMTQKFYISEKTQSRLLAALCLATMDRELTETISGTGCLAKKGPDSLGILGATQQLVHCCESWINHATDVQDPTAILDNLRQMILYRLRSDYVDGSCGLNKCLRDTDSS
ncbi:hypothetical protein FIBSPDRAFT_882459 [Athelia psychrophila]|uniref:Uncharacterized protein n=1 Tax=Athelia psychrophila TaxID=1759441 RepID=A0A166VDL6_9AGAM|nr:hypothetical protein FIBSPDRAFT_882459 [Fibularhizoctonia sp. CBS 109695]